MDVRAENRGRPDQKVRFPAAPVVGRNFLTPGRSGVRVKNVRGKSGPKSLCLCCFFLPWNGTKGWRAVWCDKGTKGREHAGTGLGICRFCNARAERVFSITGKLNPFRLFITRILIWGRQEQGLSFIGFISLLPLRTHTWLTYSSSIIFHLSTTNQCFTLIVMCLNFYVG